MILGILMLALAFAAMVWWTKIEEESDADRRRDLDRNIASLLAEKPKPGPESVGAYADALRAWKPSWENRG